MFNRGTPWSKDDLLQLYELITEGGATLADVAECLGRTGKAVQLKSLQGGLCNKQFILVPWFPSKEEYLDNIYGSRPASKKRSYKRGKLCRLFNKICREQSGDATLPINKRSLIPAIGKWDCKSKHEARNEWWRFAHWAQSNPFMRSKVYQREQGNCALCARPLSEADYQAHHSCYDHVCTFKKSIYIGKKTANSQPVPDCESCALLNPEGFASCFLRLHAVHGICNKRLN